MTTHRPVAVVLRAPGTNCDREMVRAFELAGAEARLEHVEHAIAEPAILDGAELIGFPGGFSYGDDIASGRVFAAKLRERLWPCLRDAAERGVPMIGACNGFQVLVQCGLLPGPQGDDPWPDAPPTPTLALAINRSARFVDRWVGVEIEPGTRCLWTRGVEDACARGVEGSPAPAAHASLLTLPIAHGEGRLVTSRPELISALEIAGQVAIRYREDVNGSVGRIAGVCDRSGRIFGLMPHPERYLDRNRHPGFSAIGDAGIPTPLGLEMFRAAVRAVIAERSAAVPTPEPVV